jgi:hypothetical protein
MKNHNCSVCGLYIEDAPWGEDNKTPTYEICPCCGVEFGNEDYTTKSVAAYRSKWLSEGATWFLKKQKPMEWDLEVQLKDIPTKWR